MAADDKSILDQLRLLLTKNIDMKGRRVIKAARSVDSHDYVIRAELDEVSGAAPVDTIVTAPNAHHLTHQSGGSDAIKLDALAAPDDTTTLDSSTLAHGLLPRLPGSTTLWMDGTGNFTTPLAYALQMHSKSFDPAISTSYFIGDLFSDVPAALSGTTRLYIPKACTVKAVYVTFINATPGSNEPSTIVLRLNDTSNTLISATVDNSGAQQLKNITMNLAVIAGDFIEIKWTTPAWGTPPLGVVVKAVVYLSTIG